MESPGPTRGRGQRGRCRWRPPSPGTWPGTTTVLSALYTAELVGSGGHFLWAMQVHWDTHRDQGGVKVYKPCLQGIPISGSVVRAQHFHYWSRAQIQSLVEELRSHKPCGAAKKKTTNHVFTSCLREPECVAWLLEVSPGEVTVVHSLMYFLDEHLWTSTVLGFGNAMQLNISSLPQGSSQSCREPA